MGSIPKFALYRGQAAPDWAEIVHHESIPERAGRYDWEIEPHVHDALVQVLVVTRGGGDVRIDERRWVLDAPCVVVVPAGAVHAFRFRPEVDGHVITAAQRPLEALAAAVGPALLPTIRRPAVYPIDGAGRAAVALPTLVEAIAREAATPADGRLAAGVALLAALFVQVARLDAAAPGDDGRSRQAAQYERFRALLDAGFRRRLPVAHYARQLGVTAGQLGRICRQAGGRSPLDAINARVLHEAQRELIYASLSVKQIAAALGFADEAYFGRFFRKHAGVPPTEFRRAARQRLGET